MPFTTGTSKWPRQTCASTALRPHHSAVVLGKPERLHRSKPSKKTTRHPIIGLNKKGQHHPRSPLVNCKVGQASHRHFLSAFDASEVRGQPRYSGGYVMTARI